MLDIIYFSNTIDNKLIYYMLFTIDDQNAITSKQLNTCHCGKIFQFNIVYNIIYYIYNNII